MEWKLVFKFTLFKNIYISLKHKMQSYCRMSGENESFESTKPEETRKFVGKHMIYTYENGWQYEIYFKTDRLIDYRIFKGIVGEMSKLK